MWRTRLGFPLLLFVAACGDSGGGAVTTPTPAVSAATTVPASDFPSGSSLRVVSGETGAPVVGAEVRIGGTMLTSDADGRVTLTSNFSTGALVDITADGFLVRQTLLRNGFEPIFRLIPTESPTGITPDFITEVMYHDSTAATRAMIRIQPGTAMAYVAPTEQIRNDPRAMETIRNAVATINTILRGEVVFEVTASPPEGAVVFGLLIDPNELGGTVIGQARRDFSGWNIVGGTVIYDSIETVRTSATDHELGHMLGLGHSASIADVMFPFQRRNVETYAPRERLGIRLIMSRPAFNREPDNDRHVSDARSLSMHWSEVIDCYR